jgi:hypothetical protein
VDACACGFSDPTVSRDEIAERTRRGVVAIEALVVAAAGQPSIRPRPQRWSTLEYTAHVRDVLLTIRDRLVVGLVEDHPAFSSLRRDERIELGLYRADTPAEVVRELRAAASMFLRLFAAIDPNVMDRTVRYGNPDPTTRTLEWMGMQAVHEIEHHLDDMAENARFLAGHD